MSAKSGKDEKVAERQPRLSSLSERRARNREQMIEIIIDSARDIMRSNGVSAFNMQALAKTVGIQAPSLYEYFPNRNAIFDALYARGLDIFQTKVFAGLEDNTNFADAVRHIFVQERQFSREHPDLYQVVFNNALPGYEMSTTNREKVREGLDRGVATLCHLLEAGDYDLPIPPETAALLVDVLLSGVATRMLDLEKSVQQEYSDRYIDVIEAAITLLTQGRSQGDRRKPDD